jgi:hypothetical protein
MSECPTCGRKLRGDVCPYCDEESPDDVEAESNPVSGESLVAVYACDEERQADHVISLLESEGVPAFQDSALDAGDLSGDSDGFIGDIVIRVSEDDEERAKEIIESAVHDLDVEE